MEAVPRLPMIKFELKHCTEATSFNNLKAVSVYAVFRLCRLTHLTNKRQEKDVFFLMILPYNYYECDVRIRLKAY